MHDALTGLLARRPVAERETWRSLWDRLGDGSLDKEQAVALLASLTTRLPGPETLHALRESLLERRPAVPAGHWHGTVNVVGTGGGPATFNISTASAFVAAAMGVRVVKSGSRAYTSGLGSVDLLERLGVRPTASYEQTERALDQYGIAFTGPFVYPVELARLARTIAPTGMKPFGRFLNALGPFLADLPTAAQVTGVSHTMPHAALRALADRVTDRRIWLTTNPEGADELLPFTDNTIHTNDPDDREILLKAGQLAGQEGSFDELSPVAATAAAGHFLDVLGGDTTATVTRTLCLNAAALAVASGHITGWRPAFAAAERAVAGGAARELAERMRTRTAPAGAGAGAGAGIGAGTGARHG
ncbi:anthranilate phosphoribosyltransferase [Streptomyces sp. NPDC002466]|uniref:anthranilate phosphoribosyltransferase n=1 Tax=unclassified Streptomyces TaxID=2593676 RepID=UPI0035DC1835